MNRDAILISRSIAAFAAAASPPPPPPPPSPPPPAMSPFPSPASVADKKPERIRSDGQKIRLIEFDRCCLVVCAGREQESGRIIMRCNVIFFGTM